LSAEQKAACDLTVSIPMAGAADSLNLAVAAGILMYEIATSDER
jgi:TrmH family RNA methyltransferase